MLAARQGERDRAVERFHAVLEQDPDHEEALLWLAALAEDPNQSVTYLRRVLVTNPDSARARSGLTWAEDRVQTLNSPSAAPLQPDWGGTVDLLPLEPKRTRWRLPSLMGLLVGVVLVGALTWWASSMYPLGPLARSQDAPTKITVAASPSPTTAPPRPATISLPTGLPTPLITAAAAELGGSTSLTSTCWLQTAYPATPTVAATPSSTPESATFGQGSDGPTPAAPPTTVSPSNGPRPTMTLTLMPAVATLWPTPGATTDPHTTPEPTPLAHAASGTCTGNTQADRPLHPKTGPISRRAYL
jgi:hypothetical protein